jgi:hypothetical protein
MNHAQARDLVAAVLPELTPAESQFLRSVDNAESNYGQGWVALARKLDMPDPEQYANVNNWGAITAPKSTSDDTSFFMRDRRWRRYASPEEGLKDSARLVLKPNVKAALSRGDGAGAVRAMGDNGYYIEPRIAKASQIDQYRKFIESSHARVVAGTGEPSLLTWDGRGQAGRKVGDFLEAAVYVGGLVGAIWLLAGGAAKDE